MSEERKYFELIFQGPVDGSAKTLQTLKGTFVADLEFPVDEVRRFLTDAPLTILQSESEEKVTTCYEKLKAAGAKVLLVRPQATDLPPQEQNNDAEIDLELSFGEPQQDNPDDKPVAETVESSSSNLQLDIDDILFNSGEEVEQKPIKTHEIPPTELEDNEQLFPNLTNPEPEVSDAKKASGLEPTTENNSAPNLALLDDIDDSPESPVLGKIAPPISEAPKAVQPSGSKVLELKEPLGLQLELDSPSAKKEPEPTAKADALQPKVESASAVHSAAVKSEFDLTLASVVEEPALVEPNYKEAVESIVPPLTEEEDDLSLKSAEVPAPTADPVHEKQETKTEAQKKPEPPAKEETLRERMARRAQEPRTEEASDAASESGEETDEEDASPKAKRKLIMREVLPLVALCAVVLIFGNVVYFMFLANSDDEVSNIEKQVTQVLKSIPRHSKQPAATPPPIIPVVEINFSSEHDGRNFSLTLETKGKDISGARGQLITPPPPTLSPQEIVRGATQAPWLYNMELTAAEFKKNEAGIFEGIGSTKSYIEYKGNRARITAKALIQVEYDADLKVAKGQIVFFAGFEADINAPEELTSVAGPGRFRYVYRESFEIQPKPIESNAQASTSPTTAQTPGQ